MIRLTCLCFLLSQVLLIAIPGCAQAQSRGPDKNLEVRVNHVLAGCVERGLCGPDLEVGLESARASARYMRGWALRDAKVCLPDGDAASVANLQQRMTMTKAIDALTVDVEVASAAENSAIVLTRQRFSRLLRLPDGTERKRINSVTHREQWERVEGRWRLARFTEEDQTARWEDEPLPQPTRR